MGDRIGPRRVLTRIVLWWSACTTLTGVASGYSVLLLTRFCFGMGEAAAYPNATVALARWFPARQRASGAGVIWMASQVGGAISPLLVIPLQARCGWRNLWLIMAMTTSYVYTLYLFQTWFHTNLVKRRGFGEHDLLLSPLPFVIGANANGCGGIVGDVAMGAAMGKARGRYLWLGRFGGVLGGGAADRVFGGNLQQLQCAVCADEAFAGGGSVALTAGRPGAGSDGGEGGGGGLGGGGARIRRGGLAGGRIDTSYEITGPASASNRSGWRSAWPAKPPARPRSTSPPPAAGRRLPRCLRPADRWPDVRPSAAPPPPACGRLRH